MVLRKLLGTVMRLLRAFIELLTTLRRPLTTFIRLLTTFIELLTTVRSPTTPLVYLTVTAMLTSWTGVPGARPTCTFTRCTFPVPAAFAVTAKEYVPP
jgi:hypothetical protein